MDAIRHIGRDGKLFGGVDAAAATSSPDGIGASGVGANLSIDKFPADLLLNRGILLDVATMIQGDSSPLPATFEITAAHLKELAAFLGADLIGITHLGPQDPGSDEGYLSAVVCAVRADHDPRQSPGIGGQVQWLLPRQRADKKTDDSAC